MTAQRDHLERRRAAGYQRLTVMLEPATVAALRELRARGAVSDAAAVNAAVVGCAKASDPDYYGNPYHQQDGEL